MSYYHLSEPLGGQVIISNCVFDMRHGWLVDPTDPSTDVDGPFIGIYMLKSMVQNPPILSSTPMYIDQELLIMNNTFIMSQWKKVSGVEQWVNLARPQSVGIMDASSPGCDLTFRDCNDRVRGMGSSAIINNVFRTAPSSNSPAPAAMLGIDEGDTRANPGGPGPLVRSNAFASDRVGGLNNTNGYFYSEPMVPVLVYPGDPSQRIPPGWNCQAVPAGTGNFCGVTDPACPADSCVAANLPVPKIEIFSGSTGVDPGFVGEFLSVSLSTSIGDYVDWRLLPGEAPDSPLKDVGFYPPTPDVIMENGTHIAMPVRNNLSPFLWDGESYGNPRIVDDAIDIGADEIHFLVMAGSYGNSSNSHNAPGALNPDATTGHPDRYTLIRESAGPVSVSIGNQLKVHGVQVQPVLPPTAWARPPGVLISPIINTNLPGGYRTKYIPFKASPPAPFSAVISAGDRRVHLPLNATTGQIGVGFFMPSPFADDETTTSSHTYFGTQAVLKSDDTTSGVVLLRSNLQAEYR